MIRQGKREKGKGKREKKKAKRKKKKEKYSEVSAKSFAVFAWNLCVEFRRHYAEKENNSLMARE